MNTKVLLGFLAGALAASVVYFAQPGKHPASVETAPVAAAAPASSPIDSAPAQPAPAEPVRPPVKKKAAPVESAKSVKPQAAEPDPVPVEAAKPEPVTIASVAPAPPAPEPPPTAASPTAAPPPAAPAAVAPETIAPEQTQPRTVTIASGTLLNVRLGETLASDRSHVKDAFFGTLDRPLVVDGLVIAERGARVVGHVVDVVEAGRVKGLASLTLELSSLMTSDGQKIELHTATFSKQGPDQKGDTVKKVGAGAVIGAVIGAIAGGGKGAAIGAGAGGAAGGGVAAATRGKPAVLETETLISFRLEQPVTITEHR